MRSSSARRRGTTGSSTIDADVGKVGDFFRSVDFVVGDGDPISARATFDGAGRLRQVTARWADGWVAQAWMRRDGSITLRQHKRLAMVTVRG